MGCIISMQEHETTTDGKEEIASKKHTSTMKTATMDDPVAGEEEQVKKETVLSIEKNEYSSDLILVLDLDETLWWMPRCQEEYEDFQNQGWNPSDIGVEHGVLGVGKERFGFDNPVKLRPGVLDFLKETAFSKKYETVIFTRSRKDGIANLVIDALAKAVVEYAGGGDKDLKPEDIFSARYFSDSCEDVFGLGMWYCKPLEQVVRAARGSTVAEDDLLKRVVIVDDRSDSYYTCNKYNGIPVRAFSGLRSKLPSDSTEAIDFGEDSVAMFGRLTEILATLEPEDDVRPVLQALFSGDDRKFL